MTEYAGLTSDEALELRSKGFGNETSKKCSKSYWDIIRDNVFTFFNALLVGIAVCFGIFGVAEWSKYGFCVNLVLNTAIGIFQEIKSKKAVEKLSIVADSKVSVVRDGAEIKINSEGIVLGDKVILPAGCQIPADGEVISGEAEANESLLTGESVPIKKTAGSKLLAGSFLASGSVCMKATAVGQSTYASGIQNKAKEFKRAKSELMTTIMGLLKILACIIVPLGLMMGLKVWLTNGTPAVYSEAFESDVIVPAGTLMVGMIPSGMILLTSVALAVGIIKLASKKALVQDMYSIEMLARVDTIAFDKTGTLTDGKMNVDGVIIISRNFKEQKLIDSMSSFIGSFKTGNATSAAIIKKFGSVGTMSAQKVLEFSSARKTSSAVMPDGWTYVLGAPEYMTDDSDILSEAHMHTSKGMRVMLFSRRRGGLMPEGEDRYAHAYEHIALIILKDAVRPEVIGTMAWFRKNGVAVKIISGDNQSTVSQIAKEAGVEGWERYVSMEGVPDADIPSMAEDFNVFGRVSPEQKALIIKALQKKGHKVAYAGDGVNDVISLKTADCSIAMAGGADAAKAVSNIVLTDSDFDDIPAAIGEGRRVVNNITRTSTLFLMKTFSMMLLGIMTLVGLFGRFPMEMENLFLMETFVIGIASFLLSVEPCQEKLTGSFRRNILLKAFPAALLLASSVVAGMAFLSGGAPWSVSELGMRDHTVICVLYTLASFMVLARISSPMNGYRSGVFVGNLFMAVVYGLIMPLNALGGCPTSLFYKNGETGQFFLWSIKIGDEHVDALTKLFDMSQTLGALGTADWMFVAGCILAMPVVYFALDELFGRIPEKK